MGALDSDDSVSEGGEPESEKTDIEVETPEAEATTPITSGKDPPSISSSACSECGTSLGREGV